MKRYETVQVPAKSEQREAATICDVCGAEARFGRSWSDDRSDRIEEVEMQFKEGHSFPSGGHYTAQVFDVCPTCWREKVLPFMTSLGAKPYEEDCDW